MTVTPATYVKDTTLFVRDKLRANITDPLSRAGSGVEWILTAYPEKNPVYPLITVRKVNSGPSLRLGHQSSGQWCPVTLEVRVWARKVAERDSLAASVHNYLRTAQLGSGSTDEYELFDFTVNSSIPQDEEGENGIHSEVMECAYSVILI